VRSSHCLLSGALSWVRDCVHGTSNNCGTGVGLDPSDSLDHGTAAAAILTGRPHTGCFTSTMRGVTGIAVDSFKVHVPGGGTSADGMTRAYQAAVAGGDDVITTSMWLPGDTWTETSGVSQTANGAFDAGKIVIASGGNTGPNPAPIECPANARKVLAVGAVDSVSPYTYQDYTSRGPTSDGRFKPDFLAPANVTTANNSSDTGTAGFGGTSAAAPNAAGAAALWHNWVKGVAPAVEPGQIYAHLIAMGDSASFDNTNGAGILKLPLNTTWTGGKTTVSQSQNVNISVSVPNAVSRLDAAIWWPDSDIIQHSDIDLNVFDPNGALKGSSGSAGSVFEKVRCSTTTTGTWQLQLKGYSVKAGVNQTVYWVLHQLY
jgi:serine protease AprX